MGYTRKNLAYAATSLAGPRAPVRVLLIAPYTARGGGMGRIMSYLAAQGSAPFEYEMIESRGGGGAALSLWHMAKAAWRILNRAAAGGPVIVHLNMAERGSAFRKGVLLHIARLLGLPTLLHLHAAEIIPVYANMAPTPRFLLRFTFRAAGMCAVLGEPWLDWLVNTIGVPSARVVVVRNGVQPGPMRPRADPAAPFTFLFLGNLLPRKGIDDLLRAAADPRLRDRTWRLVLAGGQGTPRLRHTADALAISNRLDFTGWLDPIGVDAALAQADALVLPSYNEGLPLVLLEAAGRGIPVITTPVGAIPELFHDGATALFVQPGDSVALAAAMLRLMNDPALAQRLATNGKRLFDREFTVEAFTSRMQTFYAGLLPPRADARSR